MKSIKTKKIKKLAIMLISVLTLTSILFTMNTSVLAAAPTYTVSTERVADIPDEIGSISCTAMGGIGIGPSYKRLFVVKSDEKNNRAFLYYFPNLYNNSDYQVILLKSIVGHANSMAVDDDYIYITRWRDDGDIKKQITRISRNKIRNAYEDLKSGKVSSVTFDADDCTIFNPKVLNNSGTYSDFDYEIRSITKYKKNGQFLVTYKNPSVFGTGKVAYTVANISNNKFVVSESKEQIKVIEDSIFNSSTTGQAICYEPGHGLFIPRWYGNHQNTVVWVNIDGSYTTKNGYRYYSPKGYIKINKSSNIFKKYEVESIDFDDQGYMLYGVNTECVSNKDKEKYPDGIIRVTNNKFTI